MNTIKIKVYDCAYTVPTAATMSAGTVLSLIVECGADALGAMPALQAV